MYRPFLSGEQRGCKLGRGTRVVPRCCVLKGPYFEPATRVQPLPEACASHARQSPHRNSRRRTLGGPRYVVPCARPGESADGEVQRGSSTLDRWMGSESLRSRRTRTRLPRLVFISFRASLRASLGSGVSPATRSPAVRPLLSPTPHSLIHRTQVHSNQRVRFARLQRCSSND